MGELEFPAAFKPPTGEEKTPPRDSRPKGTSSGGGRAAPLQGRLQEAIGGIGIIVAMLNEIDGLAIIEGAERLSIALDKAAKQNPAVRRTLEAALTGSVWAEVAFASGAIALPIAVNHRILPSGLLGVVGMPEGSAASENGNGPHDSE